MILVWLIVIYISGGLIAKIAEQWNTHASKWIALMTCLLNMVLGLYLWNSYYTPLQSSHSAWLITFILPWIPQFGISFHLALDGVSLLMLLLTFVLGTLAILTSWREINHKVGFYYLNILWILAGITGVFLAMDLFLFYFFWEVMLIPMFFLIAIWGHENKRYAALKFFIFTQASGLMMLLSILGLYFIHGINTEIYTFNYFQLLGTTFSEATGKWLMLGFLAAFIVKLPAVPFHSWLPDAHSQAPTAGSLILAGLLLKTGAYGIIRFVIPLFPDASISFTPIMMTFGVIGILYGAKLAYSQTDLKRLIAYTSVSHMGFILLGIFSFNTLGMQGVVMQMITHGISTGALFIIAGILYERIHTRDISKMGGFWTSAPFMGTIALVFAMASLGLPGLGNFVAEFLILNGAWQSYPTHTIFAAIGLVAATAYSLRIVQKVFLGASSQSMALQDLSFREKLLLVPLVLIIVWLGIFPRAVLKTSEKACMEAEQSVTHSYTSDNSPLIRKGGNHE